MINALTFNFKYRLFVIPNDVILKTLVVLSYKLHERSFVKMTTYYQALQGLW